MLVIGVDVHKSTHFLAAVDAVSGELHGSEQIAATSAGHRAGLAWADRLCGERVWAIEDCRHVSGSLERQLVQAGEHVVRVAPARTARTRSRTDRGKSDLIDALAVARAALQEGISSLPLATVDEQAEEIKLLLDHREDLVRARTDDERRLRWHLHRMSPELEAQIPAGGLSRTKWQAKVSRRLGRLEDPVRVRICRHLLAAIKRNSTLANELERELGALVAAKAPQLTAQVGCGTLTAARIIAEVGDASRFRTDAQLARLAGVAPIPASSGRTDRWRLDRRGNRRLNCAFHRWAVTRGRLDPETIDYLDRKKEEGKNRMEALRCLKRHLARRTFQLLNQPTPTPASTLDTTLALT
jgi:transposase